MLVTIEGIDGAGKNTIANRILDIISGQGFTCELLSFPSYGQTKFSKLIADLLNENVSFVGIESARYVSLLFAGDRLEKLHAIKQSLNRSQVLVIDRYVASNAAYNAGRLSREIQDSFLEWLSMVEFDYFELPKPDLNVYLKISLKHARQNILSKKARVYTSSKLDSYEKDDSLLISCSEIYDRLSTDNFYSSKFGAWITINVDKNGMIRNVDDITQELWGFLQKKLI